MTKLNREMIIAKARGQSLSDLKQLNICGLNLTDISIIEELHSLEVLALSVNDIKTLKHFVHCSNLRELYLRRNSICDLKELRYLKKLKNLRIISLIDNPCIAQAGLNYRSKVLSILPNLIKLDDVVISEQERQSALSFGCDDDSEEENIENDTRFLNQGPASPRPRTGLSRQSSNLEGSQDVSTGHGDFEPSLKKKNSFTISPLVEEKLECENIFENCRPKVKAVKSMTAREMSITNEEQNEPWKKNFKPPNYSLPNIGNTYNENKNYTEKSKFRIVKTDGSNFDAKLDGKVKEVDFAPDGAETSQALMQSLKLVDIMDYESLQKMRQAVSEMMETRGCRE